MKRMWSSTTPCHPPYPHKTTVDAVAAHQHTERWSHCILCLPLNLQPHAAKCVLLSKAVPVLCSPLYFLLLSFFVRFLFKSEFSIGMTSVFHSVQAFVWDWRKACLLILTIYNALEWHCILIVLWFSFKEAPMYISLWLFGGCSLSQNMFWVLIHMYNMELPFN